MKHEHIANDYFEILEPLSKRDWLLKLASKFPYGQCLDSVVVLQLEDVNSKDPSEQKAAMTPILEALERKKNIIDQKRQTVIESAAAQQRERVQHDEPKAIEPLKIML